MLIDDGDLAQQVRRTYPDGVDAVLDLVGNSVLRDSLLSVRPKGRVVQIGFLGGLEPVADFNPLFDLPSGVQLSTFASAFALGGDYFPITDVPLQALVEKAERGVFNAKPARVFAFEEIAQAHRLMDAGEAGGKLVCVARLGRCPGNAHSEVSRRSARLPRGAPISCTLN